jgi:23S rRNA pseudouridine2605 synthase
MASERLQKIIAAAGIASRRAAEKLVADGRVRVNGRIVTELGAKADPRHDRIEVDGKRITREKPVYLVFHKPKNVVSTLSDPEGRPTVKEYFATVPARVYPVGRLDYATSGVMLFTNDGDFAQALTHGKQKIAKTYVVKLDREMPEDEVVRWRGGIDTPDGKTAPADVRLLRYEGGKTWLEITFSEAGDPIRRMAEASGYVVMRMARLSFAGVEGTDLRPGQWRPMTVDEQRLLKRAYGVPKTVRAQEELTTARSGRPAAVTAARNARPGATPRGAARSAPRDRAPADRRSSPERS